MASRQGGGARSAGHAGLSGIAAHRGALLEAGAAGSHAASTALVHEVYVRLFGSEQVDWQSRAHFFAAVARDMRNILVDYARARNARKRSGDHVLISLSEIEPAASGLDEDLVALDEALSRLEATGLACQPGGGTAVLQRFERARNSGGTRHLDRHRETRLEFRQDVVVRSTEPRARAALSFGSLETWLLKAGKTRGEHAGHRHGVL